jgi:subtilisin family serine protease
MQNNLVRNFLALVFCLVFFSACNKSKTVESVSSQSVSDECTAATISNRYVVGWEDGSFTVEEGQSYEEFKKTFVQKKLALIKRVDQDQRIKIKIQNTNDVTVLSSGGVNWGPEKVEAPAVWAQGVRGENILVGVVDGMVDATHVQLAPNISSVQQFNFEVNDPLQNRHGSHVSGVIAADPTKGPASGVAPKAKIVGGQFIANDGGGSLGDAIIAMNSVAERGARIINMSWGGAPCVQNLKLALEALSSRGIMLVTASGNEGINSDYAPAYPASFGLLNQLNVAATTVDDFMIYFSNRGYRTVNVGAPGVGIFSTVPGNKLESMDGTSMSAPLVSGVAALLMSAKPLASVQQIKTAILRSVDTTSGGGLQVSSRGRVNARKALLELQTLLPTN